ncbi:MAG: hypothetical protein A2283_15915 [Lentisphaerae bacterium RIFOXYA12_FULL_48_11]|nr:MAG: hypothetical protein A2283_15915 [Lentisphaerae bacterium RIFOXYA12_FULL_48_11]
MIKTICKSFAWIIGVLAGLATILNYCQLPPDTVLGGIVVSLNWKISLPIAILVVIATSVFSYFLGKGFFSSHKQLVIKSAIYGVGNNVIDVTDKLKSLVQNNTLSVVVGNHLAGDPLYGTPKHLDLWFTYGTSDRKAFVREGRKLELP